MSNENFMEQLKREHSEEFHRQKITAEIKDKAEHLLYGCMYAIKEGIRVNYKNGQVKGYIGRDVGYDNVEHHIILESQRNQEVKITNDDLMHIEDNKELVRYVESRLSDEIRNLGIKQYNIKFERRERIVRNNRDFLSWNKWNHIGTYFYVIFIELKW